MLTANGASSSLPGRQPGRATGLEPALELDPGRAEPAVGRRQHGIEAVLGDEPGREVVRACSRPPTGPRSSRPGPSSPGRPGRCSSRRRARTACPRLLGRGRRGAAWCSRAPTLGHRPTSLRGRRRTCRCRESSRGTGSRTRSRATVAATGRERRERVAAQKPSTSSCGGGSACETIVRSRSEPDRRGRPSTGRTASRGALVGDDDDASGKPRSSATIASTAPDCQMHAVHRGVHVVATGEEAILGRDRLPSRGRPTRPTRPACPATPTRPRGTNRAPGRRTADRGGRSCLARAGRDEPGPGEHARAGLHRRGKVVALVPAVERDRLPGMRLDVRDDRGADLDTGSTFASSADPFQRAPQRALGVRERGGRVAGDQLAERLRLGVGAAPADRRPASRCRARTHALRRQPFVPTDERHAQHRFHRRLLRERDRLVHARLADRDVRVDERRRPTTR